MLALSLEFLTDYSLFGTACSIFCVFSVGVPIQTCLENPHRMQSWFTVPVFFFQVLLAELNTFYLKYVLWVPPPHFLCLGRLIFIILMGGPAIREYFQFLDDP